MSDTTPVENHDLLHRLRRDDWERGKCTTYSRTTCRDKGLILNDWCDRCVMRLAAEVLEHWARERDEKP